MLIIVNFKDPTKESMHIVTEEVPDISEGVLSVDERGGDMLFFPLDAVHNFRIRT